MEGDAGRSTSRSPTRRIVGPAVKASHQQHRDDAGRLGALRIAVITVSDTRNAETDRSGGYLRDEIRSAGHDLTDYRLVADEPELIDRTIGELLDSPAQIILLNGGTGISRRDGTFEVVSQRIQKTLPGFGELFRMLSFEQIGAAAMLSRATAGTCDGRVLISLPGSPAAVRLGWERLLRPELSHLVREATR